ncbi:MAG: malto-oligosyltrehalose trehalohydrolase [Pseudoxanthomonas sp.]
MASSVAQAGRSWLGAMPAADGRTRFRIWAPDAGEVLLDLGQDGRHRLQRQDDGSFDITLAVRPGARYRYRIDGRDPIPDPASRWQPDGVHGYSVVVDPHAYAWQHTAWQGRPWRETVLYELHVGTCGGYLGVIAQLPRLVELGITAIELMPLNEFPGRRNWGYDGVLPYAAESAYGTPDELKALIDAAHGHGLMVLLDAVYNHFGPEGNYLHQYAETFFNADAPTPWGPAIDFRLDAVQRYFIDNALMWLHEYRFDGLRLDAVHAIVPNDFLETLRRAIVDSTPDGRHVHLVLENEANQAFRLADGYTAQWDDDFHNALHVLLTGEEEGYYAGFADDPTAHLARVLGEGFSYQGQADHRGHQRGEPSGHLPPTKFVVFAQNHDQIGNRAKGDRLSTLIAPDALRAALALTALTPMIPLFFMGEPWGAREPFLFFTDYAPPLDEAVREGRRKEFAHFAAFADEAARASIPDPNLPATFAASRADIAVSHHGQGAAFSQWFATLLSVRQAHLVPHLDVARSLGAQVLAPGAISARWSLGPHVLVMEFNFGKTAIAAPTASGALLHAENADAADTALAPNALRLWLRDAVA